MTKTVSLRNFHFINLTDKGVERAKNEDYLAYFDTFNGHVFVVCDGMGGHLGGEIASETAVEAIGVFFNEQYYKNPFEAVENAIVFANQKVYTRARQNTECFNMGTTIVLALIRDDRVYYGHAGDSRLYVLSENRLQQLTKDHSYVNQLIDQKLISAKEAESHPRRNEITRALGLAENVEAEVTSAAFLPNENDILLLCSDGLNNMLSDRHIQRILLADKSIEEKASLLIDTANNNGGIDNISVQLIRFYNIDRQYTPQKINNFRKSILIKYLFVKKAQYVLVAFLVLALALFLLMRKGDKTDTDKHGLFISKGHTTTKTGLLMIYPYAIQSGDKLESIADKFNVDTNYLKMLNPNISVLLKGKHIKIPIQDTYTVRTNDEIKLICKQYGIYPEDLMKVNDFYTENLIVGQELIIPLTKEIAK